MLTHVVVVLKLFNPADLRVALIEGMMSAARKRIADGLEKKKKKCENSFSFCTPPISGRALSDAAKKRSISLLASGAETDV